MKSGKITIGIVTAFGAVALFYAGWLSWVSLETIGQSKQDAATIQWQTNMNLYRESNDKTIDKLVDDSTKNKIDIGTTKELVRLMSLKFQIDPDAVEARVIKKSEMENQASNTLTIF